MLGSRLVHYPCRGRSQIVERLHWPRRLHHLHFTTRTVRTLTRGLVKVLGAAGTVARAVAEAGTM